MHTQRGRPTKYRKRFCKELIAYFTVEPYKFYASRVQTITKKNGEVIRNEEHKPIANTMPTVFRFCDKIKIDTTTFYEWVEKHSDFSLAFTRAREMRREFLTTLGLTGIAPPASFIFVATNDTDMRPSGVGDIPMHSVIVPIIVRRGDDSPALPEPPPQKMVPVSVKIMEHASETQTTPA